MISVAGLSGYEGPIREILENAWSPISDELSVSKLGSLHALKSGSGKKPRKKILVATHMDAIGLMVTNIQEGFIHITEIGGIDTRVLPGQLVTIHGTEELPGVIVEPPEHTLPADVRSGPTPLIHLLVDTGLRPNAVANKVKPGDLVSFASTPIELDGGHLAGHSLDNRASIAALTHTLKILQSRIHAWDVWAVATSQEEETLGGAVTSAYQIKPDLAVVVDVTFGKSPGSPSHKSFKLNKGPTLDWGPNTHPKLFKEFEGLARRLEIPYNKAVYSKSSGTDAMLLQISGYGVATMIVSIPLRYMHTPVEMIQIKDVERTGRLLAEFITELDDEIMDKISWSQEK